RDVDSMRAAIRGGVVQYLIKPFLFPSFEEKLLSYAAATVRMTRIGQAEQGDVDRIFGALRSGRNEPLPKGLSDATLDLIIQVLGRAQSGLAVGVLALPAGCGVPQTSTTLSPDTACYGSSVYVSPPDGQSTLAVAKIDEIKRVSGVSTAFTVYRFDATSGAVELSGAASTDSIVASDPSEAAWSGLNTQYAHGHAIETASASEGVFGGVIAIVLSKSV